MKRWRTFICLIIHFSEMGLPPASTLFHHIYNVFVSVYLLHIVVEKDEFLGFLLFSLSIDPINSSTNGPT